MFKSIVCCVLSFASAKERYQRKAARETFLARKVSRDSSKEGGAFLLLRQKCFIPTKTCITPRLPNGGAYFCVACLLSTLTGVCVSLLYSLEHQPMGLWTEVILWEGDKLKFESLFQKITSIDLCHNIPSLHNPSVPTPCLKPKNKSHPVKSALARTLGVSVQKIETVGMHSRLKSANAPLPLWKSREKPFSQERFLGLLSFGIFPLQKQRKVHPKQTIQ